MEKETSYPYYSQIERNTQKDLFLSPDEVVGQTDNFMTRFVEKVGEQGMPDVIFFLDKSARPTAYMFRKLFHEYLPEQKIPEIRFFNIGGGGGYDRYSRSFKKDPSVIAKTFGRYIKSDAKILIIDEYKNSGNTIKNAFNFMSQAFPSAHVSTLIAYTLLPNWYQNEDFLGVKEYSIYDYERMALRILNQELGKNYINKDDLEDEDKHRFWQILDEVDGSILFVKRGEHVQTTYEYPDESDNSLEIKTNVFQKSRQELDRFCEEVKKLKNKRMELASAK